MRVLAATPLLALSAALTVPGNMNNNLMERRSNAAEQATCNAVFIACAAACAVIQVTHVRESCNSFCYATWLQQSREADNDLPPGIDAPVITRRADLNGCNHSLVKCINAVNADAGKPNAGTDNPVKWDSEMQLCGAFYEDCLNKAGFTPGKKCPVD